MYENVINLLIDKNYYKKNIIFQIVLFNNLYLFIYLLIFYLAIFLVFILYKIFCNTLVEELNIMLDYQKLSISNQINCNI